MKNNERGEFVTKEQLEVAEESGDYVMLYALGRELLAEREAFREALIILHRDTGYTVLDATAIAEDEARLVLAKRLINERKGGES